MPHYAVHALVHSVQEIFRVCSLELSNNMNFQVPSRTASTPNSHATRRGVSLSGGFTKNSSKPGLQGDWDFFCFDSNTIKCVTLLVPNDESKAIRSHTHVKRFTCEWAFLALVAFVTLLHNSHLGRCQPAVIFTLAG